jgi:hypothetical protein
MAGADPRRTEHHDRARVNIQNAYQVRQVLKAIDKKEGK